MTFKWIFFTFMNLIIFCFSEKGKVYGYINDSSIEKEIRPKFRIFTQSGELMPGESINITEDLEVGTTVGFIEIEDAETAVGRLLCFIDSDYSLTLQRISLTTYKIITYKPIDREEMDKFDNIVSCRTYDNPWLPSKMQFNVNILDINDNSPVFQRDSYEFEIFENNERGSVISILIAIDRDDAENSRITYHLDTEGSDMFAINSNTGILKAKGILDRETQDKYQFRVLAKDHGSPQLSGATTVQVKVKDVNDNAPIFEKEDLEFEISGYIENGTSVARITAYDMDINNVPLVYSMKENLNRFPTPFDVLSNGIIVATEVINLDHVIIFEFVVKVTDAGAPISITSSAIVRIAYRPTMP